ncbi:integrase, catalytic region, zinc finger, CCHC-type containing protein, partial [Tanacetum coccineum]
NPPSSSRSKLYVVTPFPKSKALPKIDETHALSKLVTSNSVPTPQETKVVKYDNVIASGMFRINPFKPSREDKVDNTAKNRRPQPRSNTKNDRVPSMSKNSCIKNKEVEVEEHPRNLPLSKNKKHMASECNNVKLAIWNDKSKVVCTMCKQCLITANHDVFVLNYVNDMNSRGKKHKADVLNTENQKKQKPKVMKPKKVGSKERLASPKPSKPRSCLRWSPTRRLFDLKGKIIESSESKSQSECSKGYLNLFMVRRLGLFQAYDSESKASHQFRLVVFGNYLEVAFRRNTCFVRNLEGVDLLKGNRTTNLYTINLYEMASASPICLMARATSTKSWLWHQHLSHLNFDTINDLAKNDFVIGLPKLKYHKEHLYPSCEQGKSKRESHPPKPVPNLKQRLHLLHMDLCGPMRVESINGKRVYKTDGPKKIIETMNVTFDELSATAFEQSSLKPELQRMTSGQISSGLDLTYAPSTITTQQPTERELDLLFEAMYDDYIGGQPSAAPRTVPAAQAP